MDEPRYGATRVDLIDPRFGAPAPDPADSRSGASREDARQPRTGAARPESRFGPSGEDVREPRFGATRADLAAGRAESHLPAPGADPRGPRLGGARKDFGESRTGGAGSRSAAPAEQGSALTDRVEPQFGATRVDLAEPPSGQRKRAEPGTTRTVAEPRAGAARVNLPAPRSGATRADLAESVGSTALAPRPVPDPDEVTDTGARRARSRFRVATGATEATETARTAKVAETAGAAETEDRRDEPEHEHDESEPALLLQWAIFVAQTLTGAVAGLGVWLGFYRLWSTWPFYAAPAVGVAAVVLLVFARALRRRHGKDLDLLTAVVTVGISTVLTVLPAAFTLQGLSQ